MQNKKSFFAIALVAFLALGGTSARAGTPEEFVKEYMTSLQTRGFASIPNYIHPAELTRFKEMLMPLFRKEAAAGKKEITQGLFGPDATLASVEAMSPHDFMTGMFGQLGDVLNDIVFKDAELLGSVREKDVVHVVSRVSVDGPKGLKLQQMEVVSVMPDGDGWKLMLSGSLEGIAAALSAQ
jgi:hypothetical protein